MADGARAVDVGLVDDNLAVLLVIAPRLKLAAARIVEYAHAVKRHVAGARLVGDGRLVRPYRVVFAAVGLAQSGVDEEHLLHLSVAVPVVFCVVNLVVDGVEGVAQHLADVRVLVRRVAAVVGVALGHHHRPGHVKRKVEHAAALVAEIVAHRPNEAQRLVCVVLLVENLVVKLVRALGEAHVGEFHKHHQALLLALVCRAGARHAAACRRAMPGLADVRLLAQSHSLLPQHGHVGHFIPLCAVVFHEAAAVLRLPIAHELVAAQLHSHPRAVGQSHRAPLSALRRHGHHCSGGKNKSQCSKCLFHNQDMVLKVKKDEAAALLTSRPHPFYDYNVRLFAVKLDIAVQLVSLYRHVGLLLVKLQSIVSYCLFN